MMCDVVIGWTSPVCDVFSLQNTEHFAMLGLGDIVSCTQ